jgi:hypothetical protein
MISFADTTVTDYIPIRNGCIGFKLVSANSWATLSDIRSSIYQYVLILEVND